MTRPGHIFISHGSENRAEASALAAFLEERGGRAWIAPRDVRPGMDYSEQLQLAIEECAAFVVLVTEDSNKSPYVRVETEMAFSINKPIFPVRMADVKPAAGLALFLKIKHWTDAYGAERDANLERLVCELQVLGAVAPPAVPEAAAPVQAPAPPPSPPPVMHPAPPPQEAAPPAAEPVLRFGIGEPPYQAPPAPAPAAGGFAAAGGTHGPGPGAPGGWTAGQVQRGPEVDFSREDIQRAMVGPNADHYVRSWRRMDLAGSRRSFNPSALVGNYLWLAYRKMWIPLAAGIGVVLLAELLAGIGPLFRVLGWVLILGFSVALGLFGDWLYRWHLRRAAAGGGTIEQLRARGGTSITGPVVLVGLAILAGIIAAVATSRSAGTDSGSEKASEERAKDGSGDVEDEER